MKITLKRNVYHGRAISLIEAIENVAVVLLPMVSESNPVNAAAPINPKQTSTFMDDRLIDYFTNLMYENPV